MYFWSKHTQTLKFQICFQRVFVLQDFLFSKNYLIFVMNCTRWFKIFCIFVFENTHLGIRIDAKTVFIFCFFCECLWKTNARWWKNCKNLVFHGFYQFSVTQKPFPGYLILGTKTNFWAYIVRLQKAENTKILEKSLFQFRVERCHKNHLFHDVFHVF